MKKVFNSNSTIMLLFSVVLLAVSVSILSELPELFTGTGSNTVNSNSLIDDKSLRLINTALQIEDTIGSFTYAGHFESPFRKGGVKISRNKSSHSTLPERPRLFLKGILLKERSLAIVEDERGETYIRGVGESALGQEVISIKENRIVLRDQRGTYELTVEEK